MLIAHEVYHSFRKTKRNDGWMAAKLDMEKAYDRINWCYLKDVLDRFSFDPKFVQWIMECITTTSMSVLVNGRPTHQFKPQRGLRQGDPLSPYLFILCSEPLARNLQFERNFNKNTIGCPIVRGGVKIPFLSFADDIIIFANGSDNACSRLTHIIEKLCSASGQKVNYHKSSIQFSKNLSNNQKDRIKSRLSIINALSLEKYLGCPIVE